MKFGPEKVKAVLGLPGNKRYAHFVKVAADQSSVWGLYSDGWALMTTDNGEKVFPVWPAEPYAALCASGDWANYSPRRIEMVSFLDELLPSLRESRTLLGVFPTIGDRGVTPDLDVVASDIKMELSRIE
ncbi:MAG: DUF2750 domain-containing protein [Candidatus Binataceae bacterium]